MLFETKKEILAENGKERKQLPVSGAGFYKEELSLAPWPVEAWAGWDHSGYTRQTHGSHTAARGLRNRGWVHPFSFSPGN